MDRISVILDKSGSMSPLQADTIGGFNTFLKDQVKINPNALFTLTLFDTEVTIIHAGVRIDAVPKLTEAVYAPSGNTALLDAVGNTVRSLEREALPGDRVLICVITDGQENSSREWKRGAIKSLLTEKQEKLNWGVIYLGANVDAFAEGVSIGIMQASIGSFAASGAGTQSVMASASSTSTRYFSTGKATVDQAEIDKLTKDKVSTPK